MESVETASVRADLYRLLGRLLAAAPDETLFRILRGLARQDESTPVGQAVVALAEAAHMADAETTAADYQLLFVGVGRGVLVPYASWYLTGFIGERPLARLREDMRKLGILRAAGNPEPEDHIAALCEMMSGLLSGAFGNADDHDQNAAFFDTHLRPWAPHFFGDLASNRRSPFYAAVGGLGCSFLEAEAALLSRSDRVTC